MATRDSVIRPRSTADSAASSWLTEAIDHLDDLDLALAQERAQFIGEAHVWNNQRRFDAIGSEIEGIAKARRVLAQLRAAAIAVDQ